MSVIRVAGLPFALLVFFGLSSAVAAPLITQSRFVLRAGVDGDSAQYYDSDDTARVVTQVDKRVSATRLGEDADPAATDCTVTDSAWSNASLLGQVSPTEAVVSSTAEKTWETSYHELCDYASVGFDAEAVVTVKWDVTDDVALGKNYSVNVSGTVSSDEVYGWLEGVDTGGVDDRAGIRGGNQFSRTYNLDTRGTKTELEFVMVNADPSWEGPIERETTYTAEDEFRLRVVLFDDDAPVPLEVCGNGFDDDFDGAIDTADSDCPSPEVCDNNIDDDLDGDIDAADADCIERVGLAVRCMHKPVYPQNGELVTIRAQAIGSDTNPVRVDDLEIFLNDSSTPVVADANVSDANTTFTADDGTFSYGCRAHRDATPFAETVSSWGASVEPILRTVDSGELEDEYPPWVNAVPIILNGAPANKVDVMFFADSSEFPAGAADPAFQDAVHKLIYEGYFLIPWFVNFQNYFNFWLAFDTGANSGVASGTDPSTLCPREEPPGFKTRYSWVDTAGLVHSSACRDNAGKPGVFTIEVNADTSAQVVAHETGHRPFGLGDEYCCDGGYTLPRRGLSSSWNPPFPNMFKKRKHCEDDAEGRGYDASSCRLMHVGDDLKDERWFVEPFYRLQLRDGWEFDPTFDPNTEYTRDLMQQTGRWCRWGEIFEDDGTTPTGNFKWKCGTQYGIGVSERARLSWYLSRCVNGDC